MRARRAGNAAARLHYIPATEWTQGRAAVGPAPLARSYRCLRRAQPGPALAGTRPCPPFAVAVRQHFRKSKLNADHLNAGRSFAPQPRAAAGDHPLRGAAAGAGRRRLRQDARAHPPHRLAGGGDGGGPGVDPGAHLHQQGRRRDARARPPPAGQGARGDVDRHLPRHRRAHPAARRAAAGVDARLHRSTTRTTPRGSPSASCATSCSSTSSAGRRAPSTRPSAPPRTS